MLMKMFLAKGMFAPAPGLYIYIYIEKIMTSGFLHYLITATGFVILIRRI